MYMAIQNLPESHYGLVLKSKWPPLRSKGGHHILKGRMSTLSLVPRDLECEKKCFLLH